MMIRDVLLLLADGKFHSGEALATRLLSTRSRVWTVIQQLKRDFSLDIYSVRGKGYKLVPSIELIDRLWVEQAFKQGCLDDIKAFHLFDVINSTNDYLQGRADFKQIGCQLCVAEMQTSGRGRRGREWVSPFAKNLYLSLSWQFTLVPAQLSGLSLVMGIAVCRALESLGVLEVGLKWPNDVYVQDKKLAGILVEIFGEQEGLCHAIIGLGLNVDMPLEVGNDKIDQPWISLNQLAQSPISRNELLVILVAEIIRAIKDFEQLGMVHFMQDWQKRDIYYNRTVVIQSAQRVWKGVYKGIAPSGAMLLETEEGLQSLFGGEVSLRGN